MAPHSSTLAWKIPWTEEPGRLQSMGLLRVGHDWATSPSLFTFMHWRRKWQPTPVFFPGESQGPGSLVGCSLWGRRVGLNWSDLAAAAAAGIKYVNSLLSFHKRFSVPIMRFLLPWQHPGTSYIVSVFQGIYAHLCINITSTSATYQWKDLLFRRVGFLAFQ